MDTSSHNCVTNHLHTIILITAKVDIESSKSRSENKLSKVTYKYRSQYLNSVQHCFIILPPISDSHLGVEDYETLLVLRWMLQI